jgi:hypothetical protein
MLSVDPVRVEDNFNPAIASFRNDRLHYDPECWELTYGGYRYLRNASADELFERHEQIATNFRVFGTAERLAWPVSEVFSAWYWLRKDHQLRYEMYLRGLQPRLQISISTGDVLRPMRNRDALYGDVLFRFSRREWLERTLSEGHFWLNAASTFQNASLGAARADNELKKVRTLPGEHTKIKLRDGRTQPIVGDFTNWVETDEYFILSTAADYHPYLFSAFNDSEACLVVHDAAEFTERLALALSRKYPKWNFGEMLMHYYDPRELAGAGERIDPVNSKRFEYAFEMEWRFACIPSGPVTFDHVELWLGPLTDIAELVPRGWSGLTLV